MIPVCLHSPDSTGSDSPRYARSRAIRDSPNDLSAVVDQRGELAVSDQPQVFKPHCWNWRRRLTCFNKNMPRMARFILMLLVGLAVLMWAASGVVQTTARAWFERDVSSKAKLVLTGATQSLADAWYNPKALEKQLLTLARDERVMAVSACGGDLNSLASTPGFPEEFSCLAVGSRVRVADPILGSAEQQFHEWSTVATLPTGRVHVSVMPITSQGQELGFAVLVHDLSYI